MSGDPAHDLCLRLLPETLERIRADRKRAPVRVAKLMKVIERRLLYPDPDVPAMMRDSDQRDRNVSTLFATELGLGPWAYVTELRMALGGKMLIESDFKVWRIGVQVGYTHPGSFARTFKKWSGKKPSEFRKQGQAESARPAPARFELASREELEQAAAGELAPERASEVLGQLFDLGGRIAASYENLVPSPAGRRLLESTMARSLWRWIEPLPFEVQTRAIESQAPRYRTLVLFNRLCTVSVEAEDDVRGLERAALAMTALQAVAGGLSKEEGLSVFARAWTIAAYAETRSEQLDDAAQHFGEAFRMLKLAGDDAHPLVVAELCFFQSIFERKRDNAEMAAKLEQDGREILRRFLARVRTWMEGA